MKYPFFLNFKHSCLRVEIIFFWKIFFSIIPWNSLWKIRQSKPQKRMWMGFISSRYTTKHEHVPPTFLRSVFGMTGFPGRRLISDKSINKLWQSIIIFIWHVIKPIFLCFDPHYLNLWSSFLKHCQLQLWRKLLTGNIISFCGHFKFKLLLKSLLWFDFWIENQNEVFERT